MRYSFAPLEVVDEIVRAIKDAGYSTIADDVQVFKTPTQDQALWSVEAIAYDPDLINVRGYYDEATAVADLVYVPAFEGDPFEGL